MMNICQELGFKTYIDPDGYYEYAEIGQGQKTFGIIGHLDTVPAGDLNKWNYDPFKCTVKDGIIMDVEFKMTKDLLLQHYRY